MRAFSISAVVPDRWFLPLAERGFAVTGLDSSRQMLSLARQKLPDVELVLGDAHRL